MNKLFGRRDKVPEVEIDAALPGDAEAVRRVQAETWLATYPNSELGVSYEGVKQRVEGVNGEKIAKKIEFWRNQIVSAGPDHAVFVARLEGKVVGYVAPAVLDGQWRLGALYVLPEAQGLGAGAKLIRRALDWFGPDRDSYLHVAEYNVGAIKFYRRFGFEMTGRRFEDEDGKAIGASIPELEMVRRGKHA